MNSQKHSGYHILLAYHNCIFSDLNVMWIHTSLLNLKNKAGCQKNPAFMEYINCFKYQSIFFYFFFSLNPFQG